MDKLSEKLKENSKTTYQKVAEEFDTSADYVGKIARGARKAERGNALKIKLRLEQLTDTNTTK